MWAHSTGGQSGWGTTERGKGAIRGQEAAAGSRADASLHPSATRSPTGTPPVLFPGSERRDRRIFEQRGPALARAGHWGRSRLAGVLFQAAGPPGLRHVEKTTRTRLPPRIVATTAPAPPLGGWLCRVGRGP